MDSQIQDAVTGWESRSVPDGFEGLHRLADDGFSGAVSARRTWAFLLNGRVVGVVDGTVDTFEDAPLSAHEAPDPSLPLLYAMQTGEHTQRAKYYTEDTPLSEADSTLSEGGFTGYVELSENVHSGDYYVVYHGGKSMSAAFVGNRRDLVTGDEAFERANDEIGVYYVYEADVQVVDVPDPEPDPEPEGSAAGAAVVDDDAAAPTEPPADGSDPDEGPDRDAASTPAGPDDDDVAEAAESADAGEPAADADATGPADADADPETPVEEGDAPAPSTGGSSTGNDPSTAEDSPAAPATESEVESAAESAAGAAPERGDPADEGGEHAPASAAEASDPASEEPAAGTASTADATRSSDPTATDAARPGESTESAETDATPAADDAREPAGSTQRTDDDVTIGSTPAADDEAADPFSAEERWREARGIPALDPEGTDAGSPPGDDGAASASDDPDPDRDASGRRRSEPRTEAVQRRRDEGRESVADLRSRLDAATAARTEAEEALEAAEERAARLESELEESREAREELREERDRYRERCERLDDRVEELEAEVADLEAGLASAGGDPEARSVTPTEALAGTHLFVRYDAASGPTLAKAHDGDATGEEVAENLRLEHHHTDFDTADVVVDGQPFDEFLESTTQYGFVRWLVHDLLYDIGETGNREALQSLFDAVPEVDHVEFEGGVTVPSGEGTDAESESLRFDVVVRDGMGNPLFVADLNTDRSAASEAMMRSLVSGARRVAEAKESLAAAFLVTASFFDPGALEAAAAETDSGGFFGGSGKKSYVKLSRKQGFHICLVETREGAFHVNVPEL